MVSHKHQSFWPRYRFPYILIEMMSCRVGFLRTIVKGDIANLVSRAFNVISASKIYI